MNKNVEICRALSKYIHEGQTDRAGVDYFSGHLETVASCFSDDDIAKCVAYLHDSKEDHGVTNSNLCAHLEVHGVTFMDSLIIVVAVDAISKLEGESYNDYLIRVKANEIARRVKLADLNHNMDLSRLKVIKQKDLDRLEKYKLAKIFLES